MEIKYTLDEINRVAKMILSALEGKRIIFLRGELGVGKTRLSGEIIRLIVNKQELVVQSPTYSIINMYPSKGGVVAHLDLYRVKTVAELYELGLEEILQQALCIIEWPEIMKDFPLRSADVCRITIAVENDDSRLITLE